jgi:serpin B
LHSSVVSNAGGSGCRLEVANALWGQRGDRFLEEFLAVTRKFYQATFQDLDFAKATEQSRLTINKWVADHTNDRIPELLKSGDIRPLTTLVLTNAIYFKGRWASEFAVAHTTNAPFFIGNNDSVEVPMMNQTGTFGYATGRNSDVLELPYDGERLAMVIILPKDADGLDGVEQSLDAETVTRWLEALEPQPIRVSLPRFKLEVEFNLSKTLQAMGMTDAFSRSADFSGMNGARNLFISLVRHQAEVEVNEEGTEASAATAVVIEKRAMPPSFRADHPFMFLIRDRQTGSILFLGRMVNPNA